MMLSFERFHYWRGQRRALDTQIRQEIRQEIREEIRQEIREEIREAPG